MPETQARASLCSIEQQGTRRREANAQKTHRNRDQVAPLQGLDSDVSTGPSAQGVQEQSRIGDDEEDFLGARPK